MATVPPEPNVDLFRPGVCGVGGLYRSGQLRDQYSGGEPVRVSAAVGTAVVECDGHSDPVSFGEAWDCDGADTAAELQETFFATDDAVFVAGGGGFCDRYRPGRVFGCGAGVLSAVWAGDAGAWVDADGDAVWCGVRDCGGGVPDSCAGPCGVSVVGAVHHGVCRNHRALLRVRGVPGASGLEAGGVPCTGSDAGPKRLSWEPLCRGRNA